MTPEIVMGLVLSSRNIGETDRRIVLLTREKGKISAFARGAVKPKNPLVSATRPFTFGEFFVYAGRDSYTVTGVEVTNYFKGITSDLDKYYYASYICELADYYTRENLDAQDILLLLYQSLKAIEKGTIGNELVRYIYEWRILAINGEVPNMFECVRCRKHECNENRNIKLEHFSIAHHGLLCNNCYDEANDSIDISGGVVYTIQYIITTPLTKLFTFTLKPETLQILKKITDSYLKVNRQHKFNSLAFIEMDINNML